MCKKANTTHTLYFEPINGMHFNEMLNIHNPAAVIRGWYLR